MNRPKCIPSSFCKPNLAKMVSVAVLFTAIFTVGNILINTAYAETAKERFDRLIESAELEFAETVSQAKIKYKVTISDPQATDEMKQHVKKTFDEIVSDAKILRDQKIDQARAEYRQAITKFNSVDPKEQLKNTISAAKIEYEKQLSQAKTNYENSLSQLTDNEDIKALEEEYEKILGEIKQIFNDTVIMAQKEYQKTIESKGDDSHA